MEEEQMIIVSTDKQEGGKVSDEASNNLDRKGLKTYGPVSLSKVPIPTARSVVLNSNEPPEEKYAWLEDLVRDTILTLGEGNTSVVRGYILKFQRRLNFDAEDLYYALSEYTEATNVQISRSKQKMPNESNQPFSYDPAQDYVTEL
jgi:hypothetical protein